MAVIFLQKQPTFIAELSRAKRSSKKRVTKKFLEVSRCSREEQRQRNVQKKRAARAKSKSCFFAN